MTRSLLFFGAGSFSRTCFRHLLESTAGQWSRIGIVSTSAGTELDKYARQQNVPTMVTPKGSLKGWLPDELRGWDFGVVASFPYFIPSGLVELFGEGMLNAHPSLLPRFRGAAPIQRAMLEEAPLGISIIDVHKKQFDAGRIYFQEQVPLGLGLPYGLVEEELAMKSGLALGRVLSDWNHYSVIAKEQEQTGLSLASKITSKDAYISFKTDTTQSIYRRFLAIGHQETLRARLGERTVHLLDIEPPISPKSELRAGNTLYERRKPESILWIAGADGHWLGCRRFRVEGKSTTFDAGAFYNGFCSPKHNLAFT
jgi:methionyl-tRNA formyltransferase